MTSSTDIFTIQGLNEADIQSDMTLRMMKDLNIKTNTALASLAGLPPDVASFASTLTTLTNNVNKLKSYQIINVKEYGAQGDGTTYDTNHIKIAIANLSNGGIFYFPKGTYSVHETLLFQNKSNIMIISDNAVIKLTANLTALSFLTCSNVVICGALEIKLDSTSLNLSNTVGLEITSFNNFKVSDVLVTTDFKVGIKMYNNTNQYQPSVLLNCSVQGSRTGILLENGPSPANGAEYVEVLGCRCSNCTVVGLQTNSGNTCITGGYYTDNAIAIKVDGSDGFYNPDHGKITGVTCNHNKNVGILLRNLKLGYGVVACQIWATNGPGAYSGATNVTARNFNFGIYMENVVAVNITGCHVARNRGSVDIGLDGWCECNISNNIFSSDITLASIWECGEANTIYSKNQYNIICNNIFQYALSASGVKDRISFMDTFNNRSYCIQNNRGSMTNHILSMGTAGATYTIGCHDSYLINVANIYAGNNSSTPNDQSTSITILPHMFGEKFEIAFAYASASYSTWIRIKTNSNNEPTIGAYSSARIVYFVGTKALRVIGVDKVFFDPFGIDGPQWFLSY